MWDYICCSPAVLIEGHDEALVFNTGNGGVVSMLACKNLLSAILILAADVCVFGSVEPEQRHHHLACITVESKWMMTNSYIIIFNRSLLILMLTSSKKLLKVNALQ